MNRIPDGNTVRERFEGGKPYPDGDWLCAECDQKCYDEAIEEGEACPICEILMGGDREGLSKHVETDHKMKYEDAMTAWRQEHRKDPPVYDPHMNVPVE